jgi:hypothetical protein
LSGTVSWRLGQKKDRPLLERFCCTSENGPDYERRVQRYFRVQAIPHVGAADSIRSDHRLLLLFDGEELVATACHRRSRTPNQRLFAYAAVELSRQGNVLTNGERASMVLWGVVANDILDRQEADTTLVFARVDPSK